jgi:hypothetical protein
MRYDAIGCPLPADKKLAVPANMNQQRTAENVGLVPGSRPAVTIPPDHESLLVRSTALIALGEIALFRGHLDLETVLPEIHRVASDPALAPFAEDALDNIRVAKLRR